MYGNVLPCTESRDISRALVARLRPASPETVTEHAGLPLTNANWYLCRRISEVNRSWDSEGNWISLQHGDNCSIVSGRGSIDEIIAGFFVGRRECQSSSCPREMAGIICRAGSNKVSSMGAI